MSDHTHRVQTTQIGTIQIWHDGTDYRLEFRPADAVGEVGQDYGTFLVHGVATEGLPQALGALARKVELYHAMLGQGKGESP